MMGNMADTPAVISSGVLDASQHVPYLTGTAEKRVAVLRAGGSPATPGLAQDTQGGELGTQCAWHVL